MSKTIVRTNNHWNDFKYYYEVPQKVLDDQFDWMENPDEYTFLKYKNFWYSLSDFVRWENPDFDYDGILPDSFFSGIVIKLSPDGEQYKIGTIFAGE